jgi:hypothetical protein
VVGDDPVSAVDRLRNLTSTSGAVTTDVKTFVIGFGIRSPQLDTMARHGGTAVDPTDPSRENLASGVAFNGSNISDLNDSLNITFGKILGGHFTRSKPVVNVLGTEMYVGYMNVLQGLEWQGKLDSIDIKTQALPLLDDGSTSDASYIYLWRYGDAIDAQASRSVYTSLNPAANNRIFFDYGACAGCVTAAGWNANAPSDQNHPRVTDRRRVVRECPADDRLPPQPRRARQPRALQRRDHEEDLARLRHLPCRPGDRGGRLPEHHLARPHRVGGLCRLPRRPDHPQPARRRSTSARTTECSTRSTTT